MNSHERFLRDAAIVMHREGDAAWGNTCDSAADEIARLTDANAELVRSADAAHAENDRLRAELETERMRLVACGVVAHANTKDSAVRAREMLPEYRSASLNSVERAIDREMQLRAALIAAMEIVQKERVRIAYNAKGAPPAIEVGYADILRRLDAVIAQADAALGEQK